MNNSFKTSTLEKYKENQMSKSESNLKRIVPLNIEKNFSLSTSRDELKKSVKQYKLDLELKLKNFREGIINKSKSDSKKNSPRLNRFNIQFYNTKIKKDLNQNHEHNNRFFKDNYENLR